MAMPQPSAARVHEFEIVTNEPVADGIERLVISAPTLASKLACGQFISFKVPGDATQLIRVPLSFSDVDPDAGTIETVFAVVGDGTRRLAGLVAGERSTVLGPGGHGWRIDEMGERPLLVAGGIGITPIVGLARALQAKGITFDAIVGTRTADTLWGVEQLKACGAGRVEVTSDDGTVGTKGFTTDAIPGVLADGATTAVVTCGPEVMMAKVAQAAANADLPCQVSMERMMTCGFGACATCVVPTVNGNVGACMGGPVFDAKEVQW